MRRRTPKKHLILPDPRFGSTVVTSFVNNLMLDGKKSIAFDIFYKAMDRVQERTGEDGLVIFNKALENVTLVLRCVAAGLAGLPSKFRSPFGNPVVSRWP